MTQHEKNQIDVLERKIDRILIYLLDDKETGEDGVVSRSKENAKKIAELETNEKVKRGKMAALTIVASGVISFLAWLTK